MAGWILFVDDDRRLRYHYNWFTVERYRSEDPPDQPSTRRRAAAGLSQQL